MAEQTRRRHRNVPTATPGNMIGHAGEEKAGLKRLAGLWRGQLEDAGEGSGA